MCTSVQGFIPCFLCHTVLEMDEEIQVPCYLVEEHDLDFGQCGRPILHEQNHDIPPDKDTLCQACFDLCREQEARAATRNRGKSFTYTVYKRRV